MADRMCHSAKQSIAARREAFHLTHANASKGVMILILVAACGRAASAVVTDEDGAEAGEVDSSSKACIPLSLLPATANDQYCQLLDAERIWFFAPGGCRAQDWYSRDRIRLAELGRTTYDCAAAAVCLARAATSAESTAWAIKALQRHSKRVPGQPVTAPECQTAFLGARPAGNACDDDAECSPELRCWGCPGICQQPVLRGSPCGRVAACGDDDTCWQGTCVPFRNLADGESCADPTQVEPTRPSGDDWNAGGLHCGPTSYCKSSGAVSAVCTPAWTLPDGATCTEDLACASRHCPLGGTCVSAPDGIPCQPDPATWWSDLSRDCASEICLPNSTTDGVCWSHSELGLPCGATTCGNDEFCAGKSSETGCKPLPVAGQSCGDARVCLGGDCSPTTNVCVGTNPCASPACYTGSCDANGACTVPLVGDPCDAAGYCPTPRGLSCVNGTCRGTSLACGWLDGAP